MRLETETGYIVSKQTVLYGYSKHLGEYAVASVVNALLADGAELQNIGIGIRIEIPVYGYTSRIHGLEKSVKALCKEKGIRLLQVEGKKNPALRFAQMMVQGIASVKKESVCSETECIKAGQDIVLTKWIGMEGMLRITEEREEELRKRFSGGFMNRIFSYRKELFAEQEISVARQAGAAALYQITEGGVLAALWELAKRAETGISLDMKAISVLQETVEVCEHFRLNPYQLTSVGSFLVVTDKGEELCEKLSEQGIKASLLGRITDNNDKIIRNGEEIRYIDRPAPDEIFKIFGN